MLQFYVPMDFLEPSLFELIKADRFTYYFPRRHEQLKTAIQLAFRTALVVLTGKVGLPKFAMSQRAKFDWSQWNRRHI